MTDAIEFRDDGKVRAIIPRELYLAICRIQGAEGLDWFEGCVVGAGRIDSNAEEFKKAVEKKALNRYRSQFLTEINKARNSIIAEERKKWQIIWDCPHCGEPMVLLPGSKAHQEIIAHMTEWGWSHKDCLKKERADS